MTRGKRNPSWEVSPPHKEKSESGGGAPGHTRKIYWVHVGQLSQHTQPLGVHLSHGCLGSHTKSASVWEGRWRKRAVPTPWDSPRVSSDLSLQWPVRGLNQPLFVYLSPRLSCGHWCCLQRAGGTCTVWFGSGELQQPTALSLLHLTFLRDLCVHFWVHSSLLITLFAGSITASGLGYGHSQKTTN